MVASLTNPSGPEPNRTNALLGAAEGDYNLMAGWFGFPNLDKSVPYTVNVLNSTGGAAWGTQGGKLNINLNALNGGQGDSSFLRYLLVSEMVEQFMRSDEVNRGMAPGMSWFGNGTEGSQGEGLSRFLAAQFLAVNGLGFTPPTFENSWRWLSSSRADFVNQIIPTDNGPDAATGCSLLFICYLFSQLRFSIQQIISAGGPNLAAVYQRLTADQNDPFPPFLQLVNSAFPGSETIPSGGDPDNPFPLFIPNWLELDRNPATALIVADDFNLYQRHKDGRIWFYTGPPETGWLELDNNPHTVKITAANGTVYQLHDTGNIFIYTGTPHTGWLELDNNANTVDIVAVNRDLYQLHKDGRIWIYTGTPHTGWLELDSNPDTVKIAASGGDLYQLHRTGRIWKYTGTPHTGWLELDNNSATVDIVAAAQLYQLHKDGRVWMYTGTPHTGWLELDNNPATIKLAAYGSQLYQLHNTGKIWQYTGVPHNGWQLLDQNPASIALAATQGHLYQLHNSGNIFRYGFALYPGYPV
jgi:hypothetical protein